MSSKMRPQDYISIKRFFESEAGQNFKTALADSVESELYVAETAYSKYEQPEQQIAAAVNKARGVRIVLDYIETCCKSADVAIKKRKEVNDE